jgi:hypothetical protein
MAESVRLLASLKNWMDEWKLSQQSDLWQPNPIHTINFVYALHEYQLFCQHVF